MTSDLENTMTEHVVISRNLATLISEPYQSYYQHIFLTRGYLALQVGEREHEVKAGEGIILIEGKPIKMLSCSDDLEVVGLLLSRKYTYSYQPKINFNIKALPFYYQNPVMSMNPQQMEICIDGLNHIELRLNQTGHLYYFETLRRTIDIFTYDIFSIYTKCNNKQAANGGQESIVAQKFIHLAKEMVKTERTVAYYADCLYVTPKYLSKACIHTTGHNASYWIGQFALSLMLEQIMQTDKTLSSISDEFRFQNLSHFTRFIKERTGSSPSEFRKKR